MTCQALPVPIRAYLGKPFTRQYFRNQTRKTVEGFDPRKAADVVNDGEITLNLPKAQEDALVAYISFVTQQYEKAAENDLNRHSDHNGNYIGSYEPQRTYVTDVLAFLDEYNIDSDIPDISELPTKDFLEQFGYFKSKVNYVRRRFALRKVRTEAGTAGTVITFAPDYKAEIGKLLETIRKIVNQEVPEGRRRDTIFSRINSLQLEVDKDFTTIDQTFRLMIDLSSAVGEMSEKVEPLVKQIERLANVFLKGSKKTEQLPKPERPKRITKEEEVAAPDLDDDEIPF